jgi:hypothetical protein
MTISEASVTAVDPRSGAELGYYSETSVGAVPRLCSPSAIWRRIDGVLTTESVAAAGKAR